MKPVADSVVDLKNQIVDPQCSAILDYLEQKLPNYPFDLDIDTPFVEELRSDFPTVDLLEQIKAFRWYYDNEPLSRVKKPRLKLRRWIANAVKPREPW
jgi:hypothetical protein